MKKLFAALIGLVFCSSSYAAVIYDGDVTPDVIFGSGNANGGWTIFRDDNLGLELALRAKLRFNDSGLPENTFNSNGDGTYTFDAVSAPGQSSNVGVWNFEWSINTDLNNTGRNLSDLIYSFGIEFNGTDLFPQFDIINGINPFFNAVAWDHSLGNNATGNGNGTSNVITYAATIPTLNVAQNSQQIHWWAGGDNFDPTNAGVFTFDLSAMTANGEELGSVSIDVITEVNAPAALGVIALALLPFAMRRKLKK